MKNLFRLVGVTCHFLGRSGISIWANSFSCFLPECNCKQYTTGKYIHIIVYHMCACTRFVCVYAVCLYMHACSLVCMSLRYLLLFYLIIDSATFASRYAMSKHMIGSEKKANIGDNNQFIVARDLSCQF